MPIPKKVTSVPAQIRADFVELILINTLNFVLCVAMVFSVPTASGAHILLFICIGLITGWNNGNAYLLWRGRFEYEKQKQGLNDKTP